MKLVTLLGAAAFAIGVSLSGCQVTPTEDGWKILPTSPDQSPRTIPNRRVRHIEYNGYCLASAGGKCWPCEGGVMRDCDEWYEIIDDLIGNPQSQPGQSQDVLRTNVFASAPGMQAWPGQLPGSDTAELTTVVSVMLEQDGVAWDRAEILSAYGLTDPMPLPFIYNGALLGVNTDNESIDLVVFAREDQELPITRPGFEVQILPLGELGMEDPGPVAVRMSGHIAVFVEQAENLFPIGTFADFQNEFGSWRMQAIEGPNGEYTIELRLEGIIVGTW